MLYYAILYYIVWYIILYCIILRYIMLWYFVLYYIMFSYIIYYIFIYYIMLYYIVWYIILYYITLYYAMMYYIMFSYIILYYAILYYIIFPHNFCLEFSPSPSECGFPPGFLQNYAAQDHRSLNRPVWLRVNDGLSLYGPCAKLVTCPGSTCHRPMSADRLQRPITLNRISCLGNGILYHVGVICCIICI